MGLLPIFHFEPARAISLHSLARVLEYSINSRPHRCLLQSHHVGPRGPYDQSLRSNDEELSCKQLNTSLSPCTYRMQLVESKYVIGL